VIRLRYGRHTDHILIPGRGRRFFSSPKHADRHSNPSVGTGSSFLGSVEGGRWGGGIIDRDVMLTVRLDLVPSLRIRDGIFLLPPCAFKAYTGTNLSSYMEL